MVSGPGTRAFLFTDIEGSTRLWESEPEPMREALARHDSLLADAVAAAGGRVVKHTGDGAMAVFDTASAAAAAAVDVQRRLAAHAWPTSRPIRARMAVHVGEVQERDGDYFGVTVNRCARLMAIAHGGQILLSGPARDAAAGLQTRPLGRHALRDLASPEEVHQVVADGLKEVFPPLRSPTATPTNLPANRPAIVGRDRELAELGGLLGEGRVVTVTGPGGVGKTRLAIEAMAAAMPRFPDGVYLVDVGALTDGAQLPAAVVAAASIPTDARPTSRELVVGYFADRRALVAFNDCEHLLDDVAALVEDLLAAAPWLAVLVTTRERLDVAGEATFVVGPLDAAGAAALFRERAAAAGATVGDDDRVDELCARVDHLPFAVELLASRARQLDLDDLLADIGEALSGRRRGRWSTMDETIDWSYSLLDDRERAALRRLSVFPASFPLAAARAVLGESQGAGRLVGSLVEKSLVVRDEHGRYRLLRTTRDRVGTKLDAAERAEAEAALARWCLDVVRAQPTVVQLHGVPFALELEEQLETLRFGLDVLERGDDGDAFVELAAGLGGVWWMLGHGDEGLGWVRRAAGRTTDVGRELHRLAVEAACCIAGESWAETIPLLIRAAELARGPAADSGLAPMALGLFAVAHVGHEADGLRVVEEAKAVDVDGTWRPWLDHFEADLLLGCGRYREAIDAYERALARHDWLVTSWWATAALACQATALHLAGDDELAVRRAEAAVELADAHPDALAARSRTAILALALVSAGQRRAGVDLARRVLADVAAQSHLVGAVGEPLVAVAGIAHHLGRDDVAAALLAGVRATRHHVRSPWQSALYRAYASAVPEAEAGAPPLGLPQLVALATRTLEAAVSDRG